MKRFPIIFMEQKYLDISQIHLKFLAFFTLTLAKNVDTKMYSQYKMLKENFLLYKSALNPSNTFRIRSNVTIYKNYIYLLFY